MCVHIPFVTTAPTSFVEGGRETGVVANGHDKIT